jgi:hypothetical protein
MINFLINNILLIKLLKILINFINNMVIKINIKKNSFNKIILIEKNISMIFFNYLKMLLMIKLKKLIEN